MGTGRYQLATEDGALLPGWYAAVVAAPAGAVRLDARYAAPGGGWLRVSVSGLRVVPGSEAGSLSVNERVAFEATDQGITLGFEANRVTSAAEAVAAGRRLFGCLQSGRVVLIEPCGGRAHGVRHGR